MHKEELTNRTFAAMKQNPLIVDWIELLVNDLEKISSSLQKGE